MPTFSSRQPARIAIVDCGSNKVPDIARVLTSSGADPFVIQANELSALAPDLPAAIIISGNPALIRDTGQGFLEDFALLRDLTIPILGICFGHQVIGMLYGADVTLGKEDRSLRHLDILQDNPLFAGLSGDNVFQEDHTEEVALPEHFVHLAASSHCANEVMMHRDLPVYGVQFHPESSGDAGHRLLKNFLSLV
jgi:GMP synthase (glutamine-hydrolysing)